MIVYQRRHEASPIDAGRRRMRADAATSCRFTIGRALGAVVVEVHGELDVTSSASLGHVLRDLIDNQGNLTVVIDVRDTTLVDPAAVSVFAAAASAAFRRRARLALKEPDDNLYDALERAGLTELVTA